MSPGEGHGPSWRLYLITAEDTDLSQLEQALKGGAKAIQVRKKEMPVRGLLNFTRRARELTLRHKAMLFVNDRLDVALAAGADGVHLGEWSIPAGAARKISPPGFLIGVSTHSLAGALQAREDGADFITFGPVYETPSKKKYGKPVGPDALREAVREVPIPIFALGGIKLERLDEVMEAGAHGAALISAVFGARDIKKETEKFLGRLKKTCRKSRPL